MIWKDIPIIVLDTETTGLNASSDRVIEIAWTVIQDRRLGDDYSSLIDPQRDLPEFIINLTGITQADVSSAPTFREFVSVFSILLDTYPDAILAGYNAIGFDRHFLIAELVRCGQAETIAKLLTRSWFDPLIWVREFQKFEKGKKLYQAAERLGIDCSGPSHRALADAKTAAQIMCHYMHRLPPYLDSAIALQTRWDQEHNAHYGEWKSKREEISNVE